jgi:hypothetical protein
MASPAAGDPGRARPAWRLVSDRRRSWARSYSRSAPSLHCGLAALSSRIAGARGPSRRSYWSYRTEALRLVVTVQMFFDLILLGFGAGPRVDHTDS